MNNKENSLEKQAVIEHEEGFNKRLVSYRAKTIIELCKGQKVLELGCGDGAITEELVKHFSEVVAVDGSKTRIERARKRLASIKDKEGRVAFHISLFEDLKLEDSFDTIICAAILEHVDDPIQILVKAKSWLKEDGHIIIVVPNARSLHRRIGKTMGLISDVHELSERDFAVGHKRYYDVDMLSEDIVKSGLEIESIGGILLKPLSNAQMEQLSAEITNAFYQLGRELPPDYCAEIWARCALQRGGRGKWT
jgi:2-polyprenyl-3-methyl-5-hydroxy-6-metoxy-1,4-benzoquinol methylase